MAQIATKTFTNANQSALSFTASASQTINIAAENANFAGSSFSLWTRNTGGNYVSVQGAINAHSQQRNYNPLRVECEVRAENVSTDTAVTIVVTDGS